MEFTQKRHGICFILQAETLDVRCCPENGVRCLHNFFGMAADDDGKSYVLSVALAIGDVLLMSNYDDICPKVIHTGLAGQLFVVMCELLPV